MDLIKSKKFKKSGLLHLKYLRYGEMQQPAFVMGNDKFDKNLVAMYS